MSSYLQECQIMVHTVTSITLGPMNEEGCSENPFLASSQWGLVVTSLIMLSPVLLRPEARHFAQPGTNIPRPLQPHQHLGSDRLPQDTKEQRPSPVLLPAFPSLFRSP